MSNPIVFREAGNNYPIISLGGVVSLPGHGRIANNYEIVNVQGSTLQLVPPNPKRIACIIQNLDNTTTAVGAQIIVTLGPVGGCSIILLPYGSLYIGYDFPWIGEIDVVCPKGGNPTVEALEISLE